ncbi:MAG: hypothetical protein K2Y19_17970 [Afipia birgiae]|nr:hypothetical protein [Afipia birgiae]
MKNNEVLNFISVIPEGNKRLNAGNVGANDKKMEGRALVVDKGEEVGFVVGTTEGDNEGMLVVGVVDGIRVGNCVVKVGIIEDVVGTDIGP